MRLKYVIGNTFICVFFYISAFCQTAKQLTDAYQQNSPQLLEKVLMNWSKELPSLSKKEISKRNLYEKQTYSIFKEFYKPHELARIGGSQFGNDAYTMYNYFIIPPWIHIYEADKVYYSEPETQAYVIDQINKSVTNDSLKKKFIERVLRGLESQTLDFYGPYGLLYPDTLSRVIASLKDFRPPISYGIPLYLTEKYENALKTFLGNSNKPFAANGPSSIAEAIGESKQKMDFLASYVKVFQSHWGNNWDLSTPPIISKITFDKNMHYAMVEFGLIYEGGRAFLENKKGKWSLISAKRTWRE